MQVSRPGSNVELAPIHPQMSHPRADALDAAENGEAASRALAGDHVAARSDAKPSSWPGLKKLGKATLAFGAVFGGGIGAGRGIFAGRAAQPAPGKTSTFSFTSYGNIDVDDRLNATFPKALEYLKRSPANNRTIHSLMNDKFPAGHDLLITRGPQSRFLIDYGILQWNDTAKLAFRTESVPDRVGVNSAANVLMHEMLHAEHAFRNPAASIVRVSVMHPEFDNLEEKVTIEQINARNAALANEANRTSHHEGGSFIPTADVTDSTKIGVTPNMTKTFADRSDFYATKNNSQYIGTAFTGSASRETFFTSASSELRTFNRSVLPQIDARIQKAEALTARYADAVVNGTVNPRLAAEVKAFSCEAEDFAERIVYKKPLFSGARTAADAPAPAPGLPPLPRLPLGPVYPAPLAPRTAPSAEGAPAARPA